MAKSYLPEDPFSFAPSEQEIQDYPYKEQRKKAPALVQWEEFVAPWQERAEQRGFTDPFAMIGRDIAEAERDQSARATEARMQAEIEREIGVPTRAPGTGAMPAQDSPSARPDDALKQAARLAARIGFTRLPPQKTLLEPAPRASTRLPENGRQDWASPNDGAEDRDARNDAAGAARPKAARAESAPPTGRIRALDLSEDERRGINEWQDRVNRGLYRDHAKAARAITTMLPRHPAVAHRLQQAARAQFDAAGGASRILPGAGGAANELREMTRRVLQGELPDVADERARQAFNAAEKRRGDRIEVSARAGMVVWRRADGTTLELPEFAAVLIAETGAAADQRLDALFALKQEGGASAQTTALLRSLLPRDTPMPMGYGEMAIAPTNPGPDPKYDAILTQTLEALEASGDADAAIRELFPVILRDALLPSVKDVASAILLQALPVGAPIGVLADLEELGRAYKAGDSEAMLGAIAGLAFGAAGLFGPLKLLKGGGAAARAPDAKVEGSPPPAETARHGDHPNIEQAEQPRPGTEDHSTHSTQPASQADDAASTRPPPQSLEEALADDDVPINGRRRLKSWPTLKHFVESTAGAFLKLSLTQRRQAILLSSQVRAKLAENDAVGALKLINEPRGQTVLSQVQIRLPNGKDSKIDNLVLRTAAFRPEKSGPHSYKVSVGGKSGWIDLREDLVLIFEHKTGAGELTGPQKAVRELARRAGRSDAYIENNIRAGQIDPHESFRLISEALLARGFEITLDEKIYVEFHRNLAKDFSYSLFLAAIVPAFIEKSPSDKADRL